MIRGLYTGKDGRITDGFFMNGVPAFVQERSSGFFFHPTASYTPDNVYGQPDMRMKIPTYDGLIAAAEERLSLEKGSLESVLDPLFLQSQGRSHDLLASVKLSILKGRPITPETRAELERLGWGYVEFDPTAEPSQRLAR